MENIQRIASFPEELSSLQKNYRLKVKQDQFDLQFELEDSSDNLEELMEEEKSVSDD